MLSGFVRWCKSIVLDAPDEKSNILVDGELRLNSELPSRIESCSNYPLTDTQIEVKHAIVNIPEDEVEHVYRKYKSVCIEDDLMVVIVDKSIAVNRHLSSKDDLCKLIERLRTAEEALVEKLSLYQPKKEKKLIEKLIGECQPFRLIAPIGAALVCFGDEGSCRRAFDGCRSRVPDISWHLYDNHYNFKVTKKLSDIDIDSELRGFHKYDKWYMKRLEQSRIYEGLCEPIREIIGCYESIVCSYFSNMGMAQSHREILKYKLSVEYSQGIEDISEIEDPQWEGGARLCFESQIQRECFLNNLLFVLSELRQIKHGQSQLASGKLSKISWPS